MADPVLPTFAGVTIGEAGAAARQVCLSVSPLPPTRQVPNNHIGG